jgi:hypothetical protein
VKKSRENYKKRISYALQKSPKKQNNGRWQETCFLTAKVQPPKKETTSEKIERWFDGGSKNQIVGIAFALTCMGNIFYFALISFFFVLTFWKVLFGYFLILVIVSLLTICVRVYLDDLFYCAGFNPNKSLAIKFWKWYDSFPDFVFMKNNSFMERLLLVIFLYPIIFLFDTILSVLGVVVVVLDWIRIIIFGAINTIFRITPKTFEWTYVLWAIIGVFVAFIFTKTEEPVIAFFGGSTIGGLVGIFVFHLRVGVKRKHGTSYYPL